LLCSESCPFVYDKDYFGVDGFLLSSCADGAPQRDH
jgi:hypothetical protein